MDALPAAPGATAPPGCASRPDGAVELATGERIAVEVELHAKSAERSGERLRWYRNETGYAEVLSLVPSAGAGGAEEAAWARSRTGGIRFALRRAEYSRLLGLRALDFCLTEVPPGRQNCPPHRHDDHDHQAGGQQPHAAAAPACSGGSLR